jgi:hypothetical protein
MSEKYTDSYYHETEPYLGIIFTPALDFIRLVDTQNYFMNGE